MMIDPFCDSTPAHPFRTAPPLRTFDSDAARVPYDGQTRMRLAIPSGLASARIVIDPAARDLLTVDCGGGPQPRIRLAGGELALIWRLSVGEWLREMFTVGFGGVAIVLHPAVAWTIAIRGGLSDCELDLTAGTVARVDIGGGCSEVLLDLPSPTAVVPVRISGGASRLGIRRPAETGVAVDVAGGVSMLRVDERAFDAIGGAAQLDAGDTTRGVPHYALTIGGGASGLSIERR